MVSCNIPQQALRDRFATALGYLIGQVYASILDEWQDLTILQARILQVLNHQGPTRMGELATSLGHNLSATTSLIDRMVDKELVQRTHDPRDRRAVVCELTQKGRETMRRLRGITEETITEIAARSEPDQMTSIVQGLEELRYQVDRVKPRTNDEDT